MGFFRRIFESIREFFVRDEPAHEPPEPESDTDLDDEFKQTGWSGVDIRDAYYVIEAAIDDMEDRGSL